MADATGAADEPSGARRTGVSRWGHVTALEGGIGTFAALQTFLLAGREAGWSVLFWWHAEAWPITVALWLGSLGLAAAAAVAAVALFRVAADGEQRAAKAGARFSGVLSGGALLAIALGAALRLLPAGDVPPGVFADTVYGVLPILRSPDGGWLAGARFGGVEGTGGLVVSPVLLFPARAVLGLAGGGEAGLMALCAASGLVAVAGVGLLAREVGGNGAALLSMALAALAGWPLLLSRWAWGESLTVAALATAVAAGLAAARLDRVGWAVIAGISAGIAVNGHPSGLVVASALGVAAALWALRRPKRRRLFLAASVPFLFFLSIWVAVHLLWSKSVGSRYGEVGIWSHSRRAELAAVPGSLRVPAAIGFNLVEYSGLLWWRGDPNARMGIPGRPLLSPILGLGAFAGFALLLRDAARGDRAAFAICALAAASLLAGIAANPDGAPNSLRVCALGPPALLAAARGLRALGGLLAPARARPALPAALLATLVLAFETLPAYAAWPRRPDVRALFFAPQTEAARVRRALGEAPTVLDPAAIAHPEVFSAVAFGTRPLEPLPVLSSLAPADVPGAPEPRRFWYVTTPEGASALASRGACVSRATTRPAEPGVVLVVR